VNRKFGLAIVIVLALIATLQRRLDLYSMQETLLILLLVAAAVFVALLSLIAFVLFEEGARSGLGWLKSKFSRITSLSHRNIGPQESINDPRPLK
jgi:hypothetical protein